ncbi:hypothetical protein SERLA73DRAFT_67808 [Serpula lacrymans var. lacrymans S7.3]|uniref:Uncharacterized protein n=2 Tax=Serpula lacrymans var. lacrymans TaxID=341189 RepID=F8QL00_SERL3|nr:hypothetical protein SERLA73DRAFT_67808 [Serpula lacrymans var. lacrymans S7.3]EGO18704.1 hypothetical protein SERLADRAFT_353223 [Serpula lacrymans var. lacrymans S7.9]EGO18711.1 hypothetical protein SERLADRAFT_353196 [Serpula lacrymans var. lacrymans S7.9]EGO18717.1 hypothetical protein SERLADRAFT_353213 [Serpula lacrymans var. lacrymans S7.9]
MITIRRRTRQAFPPDEPSPPDLVHEQSSISTQLTCAGPNIVVSSTDSGLEAFSHNPADDSFAPLPDRTGANTKYLNERFLSY